MLAKAAASLDLLTQGHVELGLRAGAFWEPIAAMGGPHRSTRKSVSVLSEACASARPSAIASTNWAYVTPGRPGVLCRLPVDRDPHVPVHHAGTVGADVYFPWAPVPSRPPA